MREALVAIVGRANVGKSTLVNRLLGRRAAIEHPEPGVTRDRQGYATEWEGLGFTVVDTGGWEPRAKGMAAKVVAQAERAAGEAALILFALDATTGITGDDLAVARSLRKAGAPVLVVANKVDSAALEPESAALSRLGFGEPVPVSALHGRGVGELLDLVVAHLRDAGFGEPVPGDDDEIRVAIAGRPNAGKSSLLNRLAGEERAIVDEVPGTTRDAVDTVVEIGGRRFRFIDTAGMRKRGRQAIGPEYYGLIRSLRAIESADVVLHVIDAPEGATEQDQRIARRIADSGRAAVVVLNKWDLVPGEAADGVVEDVLEQLRFVAWAPLVRVSAKTSRGVARLAPAIMRARESWEKRVPTSALNTWLRKVIETVPLGRGGARPPKIRYATQVRARPPEIALFGSGRLPDSAIRALENRLRERFGFEGTPIRFSVRTGRH